MWKGAGKVQEGHQDDLALMPWMHRLSDLSGKFPGEFHKQVQADKFSSHKLQEKSPSYPVWAINNTLVSPFSKQSSAQSCSNSTKEVWKASEEALSCAWERLSPGRRKSSSRRTKFDPQREWCTCHAGLTSCLRLWDDLMWAHTGQELLRSFTSQFQGFWCLWFIQLAIDQYWCNPALWFKGLMISTRFMASSISCHLNYNRELIVSIIFLGCN